MKKEPTYDSQLIEELQIACFEFAIADSPGIDNLGVFLEMLRLINSVGLRTKLVVHNSATLADEEIFSSMASDIQFLANIIIEGANESTNMIQTISQSPQAGAMLMLIMKMLSIGVQGDLRVVFKLINLILEEQEEDSICSLVEDYGWSEEFGHFMVTQTQQIDWTLKTQNLFDLHAPEAYVENASKTTRFSFVEQDDLDSSWTVLLHEEGEKNFELPQQKGFTVNWDLISTTITIYALPLRKKPSQTPTDSVKHEGRFSEWTTGGKRNQPGFSVDPIILASDIAITTELYN
jgi:hypothetical protein